MNSCVEHPASRPSIRLNSYSNSYSCQHGHHQKPPSSEALLGPSTESFPEDGLRLSTAQPSSYWCGRFQAIHDRFGNEVIKSIVEDNQLIQHHSLSGSAKPKGYHRFLRQPNQVPLTSLLPPTPFTEDPDTRIKRVFAQLELYCVTNEAKNSLWEWQVQYAKITGNMRFLPQQPYKTSGTGRRWADKIGRAVSGRTGRALLFKSSKRVNSLEGTSRG